MDAKERTRLRALCEAATPGPWDAIYDEDAGEWMVRTGHADVAVLTWQQALDALGLSPVTMRTAAFIAASRAALSALLDDADAADARIAKAERERDEARDRVAVLETVLREIAGSLRSHERMDPRWCLHCGVEWGTQHVATCPAGRALRVLDGRDAR